MSIEIKFFNFSTCPLNNFKNGQYRFFSIKILCNMRDPLSNRNIEKALKKVALYNLDVEQFLNSIDVIKEVIKQNS